MNFYQGTVLADRYMEIILSDWKNTLVLIGMSPILAGLAVLVWGNINQANNNLYFVMTLSMIFVGCICSCREIVKERALFLRERMFNLEIAPYLYSKVRVLALVNVVQAVIYSAIVYKFIDVRVPIGWLIINLFVVTFCGMCLGLLISSLVKRGDRAVMAVPIVVLPQILFSEFAISKDKFSGISEWIYKLMPSRWGYESLVEFAKTNGSPLEGAAMLLPLIIFSALFVALSYPILKIQKF